MLLEIDSRRGKSQVDIGGIRWRKQKKFRWKSHWLRYSFMFDTFWVGLILKTILLDLFSKIWSWLMSYRRGDRIQQYHRLVRVDHWDEEYFFGGIWTVCKQLRNLFLVINNSWKTRYCSSLGAVPVSCPLSNKVFLLNLTEKHASLHNLSNLMQLTTTKNKISSTFHILTQHYACVLIWKLPQTRVENIEICILEQTEYTLGKRRDHMNNTWNDHLREAIYANWKVLL